MDKQATLTYAAIMKVMAIGLVLLFCAAGEQASAAEPGLLRAGVQAQADFEWTADGLRGLCPDILSALQKRDPALKFHWAPPALPERRLLSELSVGDLDVACGFARSPERERQFQVPDVVLYEKTLVAVVRDGDPLDLNSLADLKTLSAKDVVLVNTGNQISGRLHQFGVDRVDDGGQNSAANLQKLMLGRGRVFLYDDPAIDWEARRTKFSGRLHAIAAALDVDRYYMLLSRRLPPDTVRRISVALVHLRDDGSLREMVERWATRVDVGKADGPTMGFPG